VKLLFPDGALLDASVEGSGGALEVSCERRSFSDARGSEAAESPQRISQLAACARSEASVRFLCCGSCLRFRFSGMSDQMSGGSKGYCSHVGFRNRRGLVHIEHLCGEHEAAASWPSDIAALANEQISASETKSGRENAVAGSLLGLAIGDALGFPCEFRSLSQIHEGFGPEGIRDFVSVHNSRWPKSPAIMGTRHPPGTYSDDTQMSIAVALGLIEAGTNNLDALMNAMGRYFVAWSNSDDNDRAPGATCMSGCANLARGVPWREAGVADSKGCGSAMRVAPIGLALWRDPQTLVSVAEASSLLTHGHPAAIVSAGAAALLVALALEKRSPEQMYECLVETFQGRSEDFDRRLEALPSMISKPPHIALSKEGLGESWVAEEAVVSALYCFWRTPSDFAATVLTAANSEGDSDSIACIAGSISGAFNGCDAIPESWREQIEGGALLESLAGELLGLQSFEPED